jgi:TRAP-type C4-dicarboxylate transport system permease small subunit
VNTGNNFFEDGQVSIRPNYEIPLWLLLIPFLIGLALIALLLLLLLLKRRRRKRPTAMLTYAILSHPHI